MPISQRNLTGKESGTPVDDPVTHSHVRCYLYCGARPLEEGYIRQSLRNSLPRAQLEMNPPPPPLPLVVSEDPLPQVRSVTHQQLLNAVVLLAFSEALPSPGVPFSSCFELG